MVDFAAIGCRPLRGKSRSDQALARHALNKEPLALGLFGAAPAPRRPPHPDGAGRTRLVAGEACTKRCGHVGAGTGRSAQRRSLRRLAAKSQPRGSRNNAQEKSNEGGSSARGRNSNGAKHHRIGRFRKVITFASEKRREGPILPEIRSTRSRPRADERACASGEARSEEMRRCSVPKNVVDRLRKGKIRARAARWRDVTQLLSFIQDKSQPG